MTPIDILILIASGLTGGYVAGLIGVGGGVVFAPVLFFYYSLRGLPDDVIAPLTIGTSLFCCLVASAASAWFQYRRGAVDAKVALGVGLASAAAIFLVTRFVTTQPWYGADAFQMAFSIVLMFVVASMLRGRKEQLAAVDEGAGDGPSLWRWALGIGTPAGVIAAAVGVGGGLLMVPAYHQLLRFSLRRAVGTSSATVVLISLVGVATYSILGWGNPALPATAFGYVDIGQALLLALPAVASAQLGVWTAHTVNTRALRYGFALFALVVAGRLFLRALG